MNYSIENTLLFLVMELIIFVFLLIIFRMKIKASREQEINNILQNDNEKLQESNDRIAYLNQQNEQYKYAILNNSQWLYYANISRNLVTACSISDDNTDVDLRNMKLPCSYDGFITCFAYRYITDEFRDEYLNQHRCKDVRDKFFNGERLIEREFKIKTDIGEEKWIYEKTLLIRDSLNNEILGLGYAIDTTKEKIQEEQLKIALAAAEMANKAKSEFLSQMSHDIRTPMNAILGMTNIAAANINNPARVQDCLEKIALSGRHLISLINEVLDMSRIESGKMVFSEGEFNLCDLVDDMLQMIKPQLAEKKHELSVNVHDIKHEDVIGDSFKIQEVFINFMTNAIKYTPEGGHIQFQITEKESDILNVSCFEFVFKDNGIGMSKEFTDIIFEPFTRAADSRVSKIQGTGLGMAISKNIVQMMGGTVEVESEPGKGSTFMVRMYLKLQDKKLAYYEKLKGLRVLIADDEEDVCVNTCDILNSLGMCSEWVLDGDNAVEKVKQAKQEGREFWAIILDWKMPNKNGIETAREIRRIVGEEVSIIILTAYDWTEVEVEARKAGVNAFISKPLFRSKIVYMFMGFLGESPDNKPQEELEKTLDFTGKRLLLVEDNDLNREIVKELLLETGIEVDTAENGMEALKKVEESPEYYYDIVFMDIQMPKMDGYKATMAIRALQRRDIKELPILAMTANAFSEDVMMSKQAGMNGHMAKPLDIAVMCKNLEKWLGNKE
ncbi:MAG: response regulator [Lachnospira sp.]|nr:response regulator [Lachnospira sp.]